MEDKCILDLDSPSYPPRIEEYIQCMCKSCREYLEKEGYFEEEKSFERDICNKYPVNEE